MAAHGHASCKRNYPTKENHRIQNKIIEDSFSILSAAKMRSRSNSHSGSSCNETRPRTRFLSRTFSASDLIRGEALVRSGAPPETESPGDSSESEDDESRSESTRSIQRKTATVSQQSNPHHGHLSSSSRRTRNQIFFRAHQTGGDHGSVSSRSTSSSATPRRSNRFHHVHRRRNTDGSTSIESLVSEYMQSNHHRGSICSSSAATPSSGSSSLPVLFAAVEDNSCEKSTNGSPRSAKSVRFREPYDTTLPDTTEPIPITMEEKTDNHSLNNATQSGDQKPAILSESEEGDRSDSDEQAADDQDNNADCGPLVCEEPQDEESVIKSCMDDCSSVTFRSLYGTTAAVPSVSVTATESLSSTWESSSSMPYHQARFVQPTFVTPTMQVRYMDSGWTVRTSPPTAPLSPSPPILLAASSPSAVNLRQSAPFAIVGRGSYAQEPRLYCYNPTQLTNETSSSFAPGAPMSGYDASSLAPWEHLE
mmetsp:Transcript_6824/g.13876  ORF Transcript_6824/g.13876 Transcript_6824/m.13876 type:complete len:479 (+) Transcript_6824:128-1564(+)|eukprot:CAMPEP_0168718232 /NCGR_PEP_ID=MMETSP0724-20121128/409_1 /TAXON_ID=265536 /ORGANISM="Amphiprora sp., Strain CCMP467" /LENGTH=478 /DNA_ID=CAMNT_0008764733 /DNA_START=282 /DNA_END=1718 /DNA_ORIENTATION=-